MGPRRALRRVGIAAAVLLGVLVTGGEPLWAGHGVEGIPTWTIPPVAIIFLMAVAYLLVGVMVWTLYRAWRSTPRRDAP